MQSSFNARLIELVQMLQALSVCPSICLSACPCMCVCVSDQEEEKANVLEEKKREEGSRRTMRPIGETQGLREKD